ncbi:Replication A protein [Vibrio scophthalmi]|uniref:Replication A protein n=1 Tax=Vibrio scophthalmi TaxID=45658 RepID=A0A1C7F960_9VIBR|nr:Replication A protein [Vibrio scophthalmi]
MFSKELENGDNPFDNVFFTEQGEPEDFARAQVQFDFDKVEEKRQPVKSRTLAELEQDELKDMAFKLAKIMNARYQIASSQIAELDFNILNKGRKKKDRLIPEVMGYDKLAKLVYEFGIKPPRKYLKQTDISALYDISRMINESWWLGRLVKLRKIMREHLAIAMGQVSAKSSPYASWDCVREHRAQQKRNWEFIKQQSLFDQETGEEADLAPMVLKSVSNPVIRRHELMVRCRGCEDIGNDLGLQGLFLTLTTPSKFHNTYKRGGFISHWNGASPRDAQQYLNGVWKCIRSKLGRDKLPWFGVRVAEPHHDGTPHWHLLIWVKPEDVIAVRDVFISYATEEDRSELHPEFEKEKEKPFRKGAYVGPLDYRPRCDFGLIDPDKGTATGYIAKYISKNIDGFAMDDDMSDETGKPVQEMAKNVSAWKSRWNIRQFQFFGGAPVTTYRELRRFASQNKQAFMQYLYMQSRLDLLTIYSMLQRDLVGPIKPSKLISNEELLKVIGASYQARTKTEIASVTDTLTAADNGDWQGYIMGQGGPFVKRKELLVTNAYRVLPFASPHGEDVRKIEGFSTPEATVKTRLKEWIICPKGKGNTDFVKEVEYEFDKPTEDPKTWKFKQRLITLKPRAKANAAALGSAASALGGNAASRSSVNNCTQPRKSQVSDQLSRLLEPDRAHGQNTSHIDESSLAALLKGSSLRIDNETSVQIRPAELDAQGNIRPARLIETKCERTRIDNGSWLDFEGWDVVLADPTVTDEDDDSDDNYQQPNLSIFRADKPASKSWPEYAAMFEEDEWPLV